MTLNGGTNVENLAEKRDYSIEEEGGSVGRNEQIKSDRINTTK